MRHTINAAIVLVVVLFAASASAQGNTLFSYVDMREGGKPSLAVSYMGPDIEVWVFNAAQDERDVEIGRLWPVLEKGGHLVLAGGYVAYVTEPKEWHVLPWVLGTGPALGGTYKFVISDYVPLNGGSHFCFSDEYSLVWGTGAVKAGFAGNFTWPEAGNPNVGLGAKVMVTKGAWTVGVRGLHRGHGEGNALRVSLQFAF